MTYQEEKQAKIRRQVSKQAITLAVYGRWQEAIEVNKGLIETFPHDVEAYNRLGKAYMELGDYTRSKEAYSHALQYDQFNMIARKNLQRLAHLGDGGAAPAATTSKAEPHLFIEETGKAGILNLYQIAPPNVLIKMSAGDRASLRKEGTSLVVENSQGEYLGRVPPKVSQRLVRLMDGGNKYTAAIISSVQNSISVIIRETFQSPEQLEEVSFPARRMEELPPYVTERVFPPEFDYEEEEPAEAGAFAGGGEVEVPEEAPEETEEDRDKTWE